MRIQWGRMVMSSIIGMPCIPTDRSPNRNNNNTDFSSRVGSDRITIIMTSYVYYSYESIRELIYFEK